MFSFTLCGWPDAGADLSTFPAWGTPGTDVHHGKIWAMFCSETLGPAICVDVTLAHKTYLNIVIDHVHIFMEMVFPVGCGLLQQDNAPCHKTKMVQESFEVLTWPPQISS